MTEIVLPFSNNFAGDAERNGVNSQSRASIRSVIWDLIQGDTLQTIDFSDIAH